jgi:hypothetical protein
MAHGGTLLHKKTMSMASELAVAHQGAFGIPSSFLDADSPGVVARLESLDDAVFDAILGKAEALTDLRRLWPAVKHELGDVLLAESREQYIRYALSIWREPADIEGNHDAVRAVRALEVLCVLFDEVA